MNKKLIKIFGNFEEYFIVYVVSIMAIVLTAQVFSRYILNSPLIWSEELVRYLFVWATLIGAGYGVKQHTHIRMEALYNILPQQGKRIVSILLNIIAIISFIYVIPDAVSFTINQNDIAAPAMGIPMSFVIASVPVGFAILVVRLIIDTIKLIIVKSEKKEVGIKC